MPNSSWGYAVNYELPAPTGAFRVPAKTFEEAVAIARKIFEEHNTVFNLKIERYPPSV